MKMYLLWKGVFCQLDSVVTSSSIRSSLKYNLFSNEQKYDRKIKIYDF